MAGAIHPVNVRVGGFYRVPTRRELAALAEKLRVALDQALDTVRWVAGFEFPDFHHDHEMLALVTPGSTPSSGGTVATTAGLTFTPAQFEEHVIEEQVPHSTALHARLAGRGRYLTGPAARYALSGQWLSPVARQAADAAGLGAECRNPYRSIVVRAVEVVYAVDEALRLIERYEPPARPGVRRRRRGPASGTAPPRRRAACCSTGTASTPTGSSRPPGSSRRPRRTRPASRTTCAGSSPTGWTSTTTADPRSASRRSATMTRASPVPRTSSTSLWTGDDPNGRPASRSAHATRPERSPRGGDRRGQRVPPRRRRRAGRGGRLRALQPCDAQLAGVTMALSDGEPSRMIDLWTDADLAVVVDAVRDPGVAGRAAATNSMSMP